MQAVFIFSWLSYVSFISNLLLKSKKGAEIFQCIGENKVFLKHISKHNNDIIRYNDSGALVIPNKNVGQLVSTHLPAIFVS